MKSDNILKTVATHVESNDPEIVMILLDIVSAMTAQDKYLELLKNDNSLFLNMGCLLQAIHKIGKDTPNIFTPIQKLNALLPQNEEKTEIESEISYTFKTKLVKSLANLSYRNQRNQELAREMEIMQSIFECTNVDARNPLIKEWSILAIRNLCEGNVENQEIVRQLTRVGDAANPVLEEFGIESGVFRIKK
jgi:ataxin-10